MKTITKKNFLSEFSISKIHSFTETEAHDFFFPLRFSTTFMTTNTRVKAVHKFAEIRRFTEWRARPLKLTL